MRNVGMCQEYVTNKVYVENIEIWAEYGNTLHQLIMRNTFQFPNASTFDVYEVLHTLGAIVPYFLSPKPLS